MPVATGYGKEPEPSTSSSVQWSQQCRHFEYSEILLATESFHESLVIGQGGFGKVYTGTIFNGSTTDVAAIKRLDPYSSQGAPEFWAEVEMLSKFRHCNLVSLFGYCNHEKEMILVYEYMPNGTLEDHLHKFCTPLSWSRRLKICIGAARGLHYLHTGVPSSSSHPDANELETCIAQSQAPTNRLHISGYENENHDDIEKPLPTIEGLQILGDAFPGHEIQASGYSRNGTTHCGFEWVRHLPDGSVNYIEGATQPKYTVTADDAGAYLAVEVQPLDDKEIKGELVKRFANDNKKITCHPDMVREIENILKVGHTSFKLLVWIVSSETCNWEPAILEIKKSSFNIKLEEPNNGVVVDNKYSRITIISLPAEIPSEFSILIPSGGEIYLRADNSTDMSCSRDTIVLTMRLFVKRAVDRKLGKKN
ncbi:hypothetical protein CTI12_AA019090 [Artemisia annua]|uniref:Protein kinase domain-containing protein n=1 Tax=Artemisia annua TaxID=35608 RepID=A0A2U1Q7S7_ARTAN|nr:hypothetical protein CTI12_AA019090 [Artemisia annua]